MRYKYSFRNKIFGIIFLTSSARHNMPLLCRGKSNPCVELCKQFNTETNDECKMGEISELLSEAINSIIDAKEERDIDSLFKSGGTSALLSEVSGLDDFKLI